MSARTFAAVASLGLLVGCSIGSNQTLDLDGIKAAVEATQSTSRTFETSREQDGLTVAVSGRIDDDYRYAATVSVDGRPMAEEVVVDDARFLKVLDPALLASAPPGPTVEALRAGGWVVDPHGAPRDLSADTTGSTPTSLLSPRTVLDQVRFLGSVPGALQQAQRRREYNRDASDYLKKFDKFDRHEADGVRFDGLPAPFDADVAFKDGLPADLGQLTPYFLYTSVWVRDEAVTRVELLFDVPDLSADVERVQRLQVERVGAPYRSVDRPLIPKPYAVSYRVGSAVGAPVAAPTGAAPVNLRQLVAALTPGSAS